MLIAQCSGLVCNMGPIKAKVFRNNPLNVGQPKLSTVLAISNCTMKSQVLFSPFKIGEFCKESMYSIIDVYNLRNLISCSMQLQRFRLDNFTKKETPPPTPTFTFFTSFLQAKPVDSTPMLFFVRTIVRLQPHIHLSSVLLTHEPQFLFWY